MILGEMNSLGVRSRDEGRDTKRRPPRPAREGREPKEHKERKRGNWIGGPELRDFLDSDSDGETIIDRDMQEKILKDFETANMTMVRLWKFIFGLVSIVLCVCYVYGGIAATADPLGSSSVFHFGSAVSPSTLQWLHFLAASPVGLLAASYWAGLTHRDPADRATAGAKKAAAAGKEGKEPRDPRDAAKGAMGLRGAFRAAAALSTTSAVAWLYVMYTSGVWRKLVMFYLPLGPAAYVAVTYYVDGSLRDIEADVLEFKDCLYDAKTL